MKTRIAVLTVFLAAATSVLVLTTRPGPVLGHSRLLQPTPISNDPGLKTPEPCGNPSPNTLTGADPTEWVIGDQYTIQWEETIDHDGYYRLAIDPTGAFDVDALDANVLEEQHPDRSTGAPDNEPLPHPYEQTITVPDLPCDPCLLQMRQYMAGSQTFYHSCAEIRIVSEPSTTPTPGGNGDDNIEGGCSCRMSAPRGASWLSGLLVALSAMVATVVRRR